MKSEDKKVRYFVPNFSSIYLYLFEKGGVIYGKHVSGKIERSGWDKKIILKELGKVGDDNFSWAEVTEFELALLL